MYPIKTEGASEEFTACWISAGKYIDLYYESQFKNKKSSVFGNKLNKTLPVIETEVSDSGSFDNALEFLLMNGRSLQDAKKINWLKADLTPPFIEHLSFIFCNQIFFIQLYDIDGILETPNNNLQSLISLSNLANAKPCLMPMKKVNDEWQPQGQNWCLFEPYTNKSISPEKLVSNEEVEMSDWEIQDMAVTEVKNKLERDGKKIVSWNSHPDVDPSVWFYDETGTNYVVVRSGRSPQLEVEMPSNIEKIKNNSEPYGLTHSTFKTPSKGYFVSAIIADSNDSSKSLVRGVRLHLKWNTRDFSGNTYEGSSWATEE